MKEQSRMEKYKIKCPSCGKEVLASRKATKTKLCFDCKRKRNRLRTKEYHKRNKKYGKTN